VLDALLGGEGGDGDAALSEAAAAARIDALPPADAARLADAWYAGTFAVLRARDAVEVLFGSGAPAATKAEAAGA
jgi:hypothetical protein